METFIVNEIYKIKITSFNGKKIKDEIKLKSFVNISDLNSGIYFIKLTDKEGKTGVTKFIKN